MNVYLCHIAAWILLLSTVFGKAPLHGRIVNTCDWFSQGKLNRQVQNIWGRIPHICAKVVAFKQFDQASSNCLSCYDGQDACSQPPVLLYHMYFNAFHIDWRADVRGIQSILLTENLDRVKVIVWTEKPDLLLRNEGFQTFLRQASRTVEVHRVQWMELIRDTPFENHKFFGTEATVRRMLPAAPFTDVLRLLILYWHGGVWIDTDVVLLRPLYPLVVNVGYQFFMRWQNNHVLHLARLSPLSRRLLETAAAFPTVFDDVLEHIRLVCRPVGYFPASPWEYGFLDMYNGCLLRYALMHNNSGTPAEVLYDYPLGWFDPVWARCYPTRKAMDDRMWILSASRYYALHTRWPKVPQSVDPIEPSSPLDRVFRIIDKFFDGCKDKDCIPVGGAALLTDFDYWPTSVSVVAS